MIRLSLLCLCLFFPLLGRAQTPVRMVPGEQKALITFRSEYGLNRASTNAWTRFCKSLGEHLTLPEPGFLSAFTCQSYDTPQPPTSRLWHIELNERKGSFEIKLRFLSEGESLDIQSVSFPIEGQLLEKLNNEVLALAIARMLVESNPTGWAYKHKTEQPSFATEGELLPFPEELLVYELSFQQKEQLWLPTMRARMSRVRDLEEGEDKKRIKYSLNLSQKTLKIGKTYWIRSRNDEERQDKYQAIISKALMENTALALSGSAKNKGSKGETSFVDDYLFSSFQSSFAGFRYGKSIAKSDSLVTRIDMISILAEIGSGPLAGLRWYYDIFPELKRGSGNSQEYFSLRRASLGWAFSLNMPLFIHPLFNTIDIQPKVGLLDLKSQFFASTPEGNASLDFNVKNFIDLSVEIGIEKTTPWLRSRLWGSTGTANFGVSKKDSVTVKSLRGGIDLYFDLYKARKWDVNLLTFATMEKLELSKDPKSLDANSLELYAISPNLVFAGLGFTVSW